MKQIISHLPMVQVLKIRSFFILWYAQLLTFIVSNMLTFVLGVMIYSQTRLNSQVSLLYLAIGIPATIFGLGSGLIVDSFVKKNLLFWSILLRAIVLIFIYFNFQNVALILLSVAVFTSLGQIFIPAQASLIPRLVPASLLFTANSLFTITFYASIIGGFVMGGPLLEKLGTAAVLILFILIYIFAAILILFLPKNLDNEVNDKQVDLNTIITDFKFLVNFIRQTTYVGKALILITVIQVVVTIFMILGPGFVDRVLNLKLTDASVVILGPAMVGMIVGALCMGILGSYFKKRSLIFTGVFFGGLLLVFLAAFIKGHQVFKNEMLFSFSWFKIQFLPVTIAVMFMMGICFSMIDISCNTILQERTSDEVRGRVYGMLSTLISGVSLLPVVISGVLADIIGIEKIIFVLGLLLIGFGTYIGRKYPAN